jgi:hypothetical protein
MLYANPNLWITFLRELTAVSDTYVASQCDDALFFIDTELLWSKMMV